MDHMMRYVKKPRQLRNHFGETPRTNGNIKIEIYKPHVLGGWYTSQSIYYKVSIIFFAPTASTTEVISHGQCKRFPNQTER